MKQQKLYHGACFYPELWNEAVLEEDIHMMKETGINVVRIGEFAWSKMEPEEGCFDISFLRMSFANWPPMKLKPSCARRLPLRRSG
ncbi:beta-galactosidase [Bacillus sonorensis]|nr:beta-galactosidase [Bacillus sonorensis]